MYVSKNFSVDVEDLLKIENQVKKGNFKNSSEFVQNAIKKQLLRD